LEGRTRPRRASGAHWCVGGAGAAGRCPFLWCRRYNSFLPNHRSRRVIWCQPFDRLPLSCFRTVRLPTSGDDRTSPECPLTGAPPCLSLLTPDPAAKGKAGETRMEPRARRAARRSSLLAPPSPSIALGEVMPITAGQRFGKSGQHSVCGVDPWSSGACGGETRQRPSYALSWGSRRSDHPHPKPPPVPARPR
jgi:hypothetical protein